jgi:hypothetical protein
MSSFNKSDDIDIIYYNISIDNTGNEVSGKTYGKNADFIESKINAFNTTPILENPNKYFGSIVRMEIPAFAIPLVNIQIKTPINSISDVNTMINSFTLKYGNSTTNQINLIWTPQIYSPVGQIPTYTYPSNTQIYNAYYYCYCYAIWANMCNTALKTAMTELKTLEPSLSTAKDPFFYYDAQTQLFSLYADKLFFDRNLPNYIEIFTNSVSSQIYNGFLFDEKSVGSVDGTDEVFLIYNFNNINIKTINSVDYIVMTQEFVNLAYMSPLKSIVIATNMNVISEIFFVNNPSATQNNQYINVLTDFLPDLSGVSEAGVGSKIFIYNASSLWRIFQFTDKNPLYNISLSMYWVDINNNFNYLLLPKGLLANIKMMFISTKFYNTNLSRMISRDFDLLNLSNQPANENTNENTKENDDITNYITSADNPRTTGFPDIYNGGKFLNNFKKVRKSKK